MNLIPHITLYLNEIVKLKRYLAQTLLGPLASVSAYIFIMGSVIGERVGEISNYSYGVFIIPGLLLLQCTTYAFHSGNLSIYGPRMNDTIFEWKMARIPFLEILIVLTLATVTKTLLLACAVLGAASLQVSYDIYSPVLLLFFLVTITATFSLVGLTLGVASNDSNITMLVPQIIMVPLLLTGGIFYSAEMLPDSIARFILLNPFYYYIESIRYSILGTSAVSTSKLFSVDILSFFTVLLVASYICKTSKALFK